MHEISLMKSLMRQIDTAAASEGAHRVVGVSVWVGALTNMSAEHFIEHFEHAAAGTIAEGARMEVTVSEDPQHRDALNVVLKGVEVEF